ncbi:Mov34-domain-containing protein [Hysterangium stoloniferum]|nr:Mov34-domain-containing protein [Hysterangium stoloniferum]
MPQTRPSKDSRILLTDQIHADEKATLYKPELKIVMVPNDVTTRFLSVAAVNTARNKETCGLLLGKKEGPKFRVTTLLIPKQRCTEQSCTMEEEELITDFTQKRKLITLGWIHTHPTQTCFFTSSDLHTHANFQSMLPEFFGIVCAPKQIPPYGVFRLTDPLGLNQILRCTEKDTFHVHDENMSIYTDADKGHVSWISETLSEIVDLR